MSLLAVKDLCVHFPTRRGIIHAVDGVSFEIKEGETFGLVGESGCGKSTLCKALMRLLDPTAGSIVLEGDDITHLGRRDLRRIRSKVQMIFQDPYASLNPRKRVGEIIEAPLQVHRRGSSRDRRDRVRELLELVGLDEEAIHRFPHEFSGGQRQRIVIARALALNPKLIICDEPVSALDVSIRAQILNLLTDLQIELGLSYLFISHDLSVVETVSDRVAVMYLGKIMEIADAASLWASPRHPYTEALLSAIPLPDPDAAARKRRILLPGELPDPADPPRGCVFNSRCPRVRNRCFEERPPILQVEPGHSAACHFV